MSLNITEEWLVSIGFLLDSLKASLLIPPLGERAILEVCCQPEPMDGTDPDEWLISLLQDERDHVLLTSRKYRTQDDLLELLHALGWKKRGVL